MNGRIGKCERLRSSEVTTRFAPAESRGSLHGDPQAMERLAMTKVREILRLRWGLERSVREASRAAGVSVGVVSKTERRALRAGLDWPAVEALDDTTL